ncbi:MAG: guanylate kinase [Candidatus Sumerlaeia bacterium]|nr:guanylate kinase [Candidatus Sumerlaeia bacterium]
MDQSKTAISESGERLELPFRRRNRLFVISAPSGGGKTTIVRALLAADPHLAHSISTTTRAPRPGEVEERSYCFVSQEEFDRLVKEDRFLEWARVHGHCYGTRRDQVQAILDSGRDAILAIDVQGAQSVRQAVPDAVLIFLWPPSKAVLEARLRLRGSERGEEIARRMRTADEEMRAAPLFDYLVLNDQLETAIAQVRAIIEAERCRVPRADGLKDGAKRPDRPKVSHPTAREFAPAIICASRVMVELLERAERVARTDSPVLLLGESGTGKELLAEAIHRAGPRAGGPLVRVNCGAIPPTLLESELFGHVAGAFTGAVRDHAGLFRVADGGAIFLDEIADLPLDLQVKLLRVLQDGELRPVGGTQPIHVNVRVIAATNRDLAADVEAGRFRQDLFYRLNVVPLRLPPLRERREDIPLLVEHFLGRLAARGYPVKPLASEALDFLVGADWPGNVRQLENALEHAVVLSKGEVIQVGDFPESVRHGRISSPPALSALPVESLEAAEIYLIRRALEQTGSNITRAGRLLGLSRRALTRRIEKLGIPVTRRRGRPKPA